MPSPSADRAAVEGWFANRSGAGIVAVKRMAAIYVIIAEGDISKKPQKKTHARTTHPKSKRAPKVEKRPPALISPQSPTPNSTPEKADQRSTLSAPDVRINLEIHISSDATPDQIDKIFESMAKHVYKK